MNLRHNIKWNILASWAAHAVSLLVGFLLMPYVLHTLGDRAYGGWIFINSIASYAGLMYLGFGDTISRFVATHHTRQDWRRLNESVNVVFAVYTAMGAAAVAASWLIAWLLPSFRDWHGDSLVELRAVVLLLGLNVASGMIGSVFGGVLLGIQRFDLVRGITIASDLLRVAAILLVLRAEWGLLTLASIQLSVTVIENLSYYAAVRRHVPTLSIGRRFLSMAALKECFGFSAFAFLGAVASQLIYATDTIVIGIVLGAEAIVPYHVAMRLCQFMRRPIEQVGEVCMPKAGELHAVNDLPSLNQLVIRGVGTSFLLVAGMFIGTVYFGGDLIRLWVGDGYSSSHQLLLVLLGAQVIALPLGVVRSILFGMGQARVPALLYLAEAVANLVLSLVLIGPFGIYGVALGTAIPIVLMELGLLLPFVLKQLHMRLKHMLAAVVAPQIVPLAALLAYSSFVHSQLHGSGFGWSWLAAVAVGGGAVLGTAWFVQSLASRHFRPARLLHSG